jgi:cytochrome c
LQEFYSYDWRPGGAGGLVWDEANLTEYITNPKAKVPGNKMAFPGLKAAADVANVIAYLKADPKP